MAYPDRFTHLAVARERFGSRVERYGKFLTQGDPLGDAAVEALSGLSRDEREALIDKSLSGEPAGPKELRDLVEQASSLPLWFDSEWATEGGRVLLRAGVAGGVVLGFKSLVGSYTSPAGNKPLIFSQRLEEDVPRRLAETGRFVRAMAEPEGFRIGTKAFRSALRVRLVHAQVRRFLNQSPKWNRQAWGEPINQADMSATNLLFSYVFSNGMDQLGITQSPSDRESLLHLWRGVGHVLGLDPELLTANTREARDLWDLTMMTQNEPDEDSRRLAKAFMEVPLRSATTDRERRIAQLLMPVRIAIARELIGPKVFDPLGFPKSPVGYGLPVLRQFVRALGAGMRLNPFAEAVSLKIGNTYWEVAVEQILRHDTQVFGLPTKLPGIHTNAAEA